MRVREEKKLRASHARGGRRHAVPFLRIVHLPTDSLLEEQKKKKAAARICSTGNFFFPKKRLQILTRSERRERERHERDESGNLHGFLKSEEEEVKSSEVEKEESLF